jgi:hypothetical protein
MIGEGGYAQMVMDRASLQAQPARAGERKIYE